MSKGRRGNARFEVLAICGKKVLPVPSARPYKLIFPRKKPVIMFGFLGTWQFSSKAAIWLCDGVLCLARPV